MFKTIFVLIALVFSVGATAAPVTSSNVESYIDQLMNSAEFSDLQAQSCVSQEGVREILRAQLGDTLMKCRPEGARCGENSDCCNNHCVGIRCNDNAGH